MKAKKLTPEHLGTPVTIKWEDGSRYSGTFVALSAGSEIAMAANGEVVARTLEIHVEVASIGRNSVRFMLDGSEEVTLL